MGIIKLMLLFRVRQTKLIWLGVFGLTFHFMACACKGCKPTSEIKTFNSNVKQNILNDEKR